MTDVFSSSLRYYSSIFESERWVLDVPEDGVRSTLDLRTVFGTAERHGWRTGRRTEMYESIGTVRDCVVRTRGCHYRTDPQEGVSGPRPETSRDPPLTRRRR